MYGQYKGFTGLTFNCLILIEELGTGSCGTAYLTHRNTVLKITRSYWEFQSMFTFKHTDDDFVKRSHCEIYDMWTDGDKYFIEKEFIPRRPLYREYRNWLENIIQKSQSYHMLNDYGIEENIGMRENGEIICFDGMINTEYLIPLPHEYTNCYF